MSETEDVERVQKALLDAAMQHTDCADPVDALFAVAPRVLAAIRAAADIGFQQGLAVEKIGAEYENADWALDAALAALTDHPGGTEK